MTKDEYLKNGGKISYQAKEEPLMPLPDNYQLKKIFKNGILQETFLERTREFTKSCCTNDK
jgi:hypothetical protein